MTESTAVVTAFPSAKPKPRKASAKVASMIRVNQAGEYGAKRIYKGQLDFLRNISPETRATIEHMEEQEQEHLDAFNRQIATRQVQPTLLTPIWHAAGYAMGAATALMGEKAAMACTAAVEEVIDEHYQEQLNELEGEDEEELRALITKCREDELEHRDTAYEHGAAEAPAYPVLSFGIKTASRMAIWLSKRI